MIPGGAEGQQAVTPNNEVLDGLMIGSFNPAIGTTGGYELGGFSDGVSIQMNRTAKVKVELLGWEAGFENSFTLDGQTVGKGLNGLSGAQTVVGDALDTFMTGLISSLDFAFTSENGGNPKGGVSNGDANSIPGQNFFVSVVGKEGSRNGNTLYIFYDDDNVLNDNHDDLAGLNAAAAGAGAARVRGLHAVPGPHRPQEGRPQHHPHGQAHPAHWQGARESRVEEGTPSSIVHLPVLAKISLNLRRC